MRGHLRTLPTAPDKPNNPLNQQPPYSSLAEHFSLQPPKLYDMGGYSVPIKRADDGNPQGLTWAQLHQKWDTTLTEISRNTTFDESTTADDPTLSTLFTTISGFVSASIRNTELLGHIIERAVMEKSLTVTKYHIACLADPDALGRLKMTSACRTAALIVTFFACPASISEILKVQNWLQAPCNWAGFMEDLNAGKKSVRLREEYGRMKKAVLSEGDKNTMTLLVASAHSRGPIENGLDRIHLVGLVSSQHTFVIAIGNEGASIFQGVSSMMKLPDVSLEQWRSKGNATLRNEQEMEDFMRHFDVLQKSSVRTHLVSPLQCQSHKSCRMAGQKRSTTHTSPASITILRHKLKIPSSRMEGSGQLTRITSRMYVLWRYLMSTRKDIKKFKWSQEDGKWLGGRTDLDHLKYMARNRPNDVAKTHDLVVIYT